MSVNLRAPAVNERISRNGSFVSACTGNNRPSACNTYIIMYSGRPLERIVFTGPSAVTTTGDAGRANAFSRHARAACDRWQSLRGDKRGAYGDGDRIGCWWWMRPSAVRACARACRLVKCHSESHSSGPAPWQQTLYRPHRLVATIYPPRLEYSPANVRISRRLKTGTTDTRRNLIVCVRVETRRTSDFTVFENNEIG